MSKKEDENPLEEIQKQLRDLLKNRNVQVAFAPFMGQASQGEKADEETDDSSGLDESEEEAEVRLDKIRRFDRRPKEIRDYLDRFVVKQEQAKRVLSVAVCDHYNHVRRCLEKPEVARKEHVKPNVLILGPTGVGKTYLMRMVARLIGVPFVKADATKFSETGYVGYDVEDLVRDLVKAADGDVELAEYGIIYVDEIDKIAGEASRGGGRDVSGRGVQINLLKLMEDTEVNLHSAHDMMGQMKAMMEMQRGGSDGSSKNTINTKNVLFIVSGAFDRLAEDVKKRLSLSRIGFGSSEEMAADDGPDSRFLHQAETRDFIQYGFEPEFVGRLPVRVACDELAAADLADILRSSEGNALEQFKGDFAGYDVKMNVADEALDSIAEQAAKEQTGARGLVTVLERIFRDFKFELPSTAVRSFEVDAALVDDPAAALRRLIEENKDLFNESLLEDVDRFAKEFAEEHEYRLKFRKPAKVALAKLAAKENRSVRSVCERKFRDFEHGLSIIFQRTGKNEFVIDKKVVDDPDKELSKWVVDSFGSSEEGSDDEP